MLNSTKWLLLYTSCHFQLHGPSLAGSYQKTLHIHSNDNYHKTKVKMNIQELKYFVTHTTQGSTFYMKYIQSYQYQEVRACDKHRKHESGECSCDFKSLRMFVSGVGGTGKFFLIHALKSLIHQIWPSSDLSCAIAAPLDWQH